MNGPNGQWTLERLARMIDLSAVRAEADADEIRRLAEAAKRYRCICVFVLPAFLPELKAQLADAPEVGLGGVVGFPSGGHGTAIKVAEARDQLAQGATELDMVINVGMLRSGRDRFVEDDIRAVVEAADGTPLKVILEAHHLSDEEIVRGSRLAVRAGARLRQDRDRLVPDRGHAPQRAVDKADRRRRGPGESRRRRPRPGHRDRDCTAWA